MLPAGAPCPQELCKNVIAELNMKDFVVCYGMTETSPVTFQVQCSTLQYSAIQYNTVQPSRASARTTSCSRPAQWAFPPTTRWISRYLHVLHFPLQEMAVMDSEGKIVEAGVEGELVTRGYSTMLGYWEDKSLT